MSTPFISGTSVYLRTITEADLNERYRDWFNDEEVTRANNHHRFPMYGENVRDYYDRVIRSRDNLVLAVCAKDNDTHIGNIALLNIDLMSHWAEIAILIGEKSHWGKGIGREAVYLLTKHAFDELNLHRLYAGTHADNIAFQKLAESLGFQKEGVARDGVFKGGVFLDIIHYGLLREEFKRQS